MSLTVVSVQAPVFANETAPPVRRRVRGTLGRVRKAGHLGWHTCAPAGRDDQGMMTSVEETTRTDVTGIPSR
jgi:hypothetical protein